MLRRGIYALLVVGLAACETPSVKAPLGNQTNRFGFNHSTHSGAEPQKMALLTQQGGVPGCAECHVLADPKHGTLSRPGSAEHAPCDRCHKQEFFKPPGRFCAMCHVRVDPRVNSPDLTPSQMTPWPPIGATRRYAAVFNHRLHLDKDAMEKRLGYHASCRDCHLRESGQERAQMSGHAGCAHCHGGASVREGAARPQIEMRDCQKCHVSETYAVPQGRRFITRDLTFSHAKHEKDKAGTPILCGECHREVEDAINVESIMLPKMVDCAKCHEDSKRTGPDKRISSCGLCHQQITAGVAPRNHLGTAAPDTHTIVFRTDHAAAARDPNARCRFCHGGFSGAKQDQCFECHVIMKPRDHTLRWATFDHGPEAANTRERCALCHEADYCASCHSQRPRSHIPYDSFVNGGHSTEARLNLRACMACHDYTTTCSRCHNGQAFPGGRVR